MVHAVLALIALQQPVDSAYTAKIRELTTEPRFNTELTDHLPADARVPSPLKVLGYVPGTVGVLDAPVGKGHVVLFAIRPFWRWETQGSFALVFNTILNWNDLGVAWPPAPKPNARAVAAPDKGP